MIYTKPYLTFYAFLTYRGSFIWNSFVTKPSCNIKYFPMGLERRRKCTILYAIRIWKLSILIYISWLRLNSSVFVLHIFSVQIEKETFTLYGSSLKKSTLTRNIVSSYLYFNYWSFNVNCVRSKVYYMHRKSNLFYLFWT